MTMALCMSACLMLISVLCFKSLYSCLLRFFFLGALCFCFCKSCSTNEHNDSSWNSPLGLAADFNLNDLC